MSRRFHVREHFGCISGKIGYRSRLNAKLGKADLPVALQLDFYKCPICHYWHSTLDEEVAR